MATDSDKKELTCMFCPTKYVDFPLDVMVTDSVWRKITGREDGLGVVCAACIVRKVAELMPNVTVGRLTFDQKLNGHNKVSLEEMFPNLNV